MKRIQSIYPRRVRLHYFAMMHTVYTVLPSYVFNITLRTYTLRAYVGICVLQFVRLQHVLLCVQVVTYYIINYIYPERYTYITNCNVTSWYIHTFPMYHVNPL